MKKAVKFEQQLSYEPFPKGLFGSQISHLYVLESQHTVTSDAGLYAGGWFQMIMPLIMLFPFKRGLELQKAGISLCSTLRNRNAGSDNSRSGIITALVYVNYILWIASIFLSVLILKKAFPQNGIFKKTDHNKLEADLAQSQTVKLLRQESGVLCDFNN